MKGPLSFSGATSLYIHFPLCRIKCSYCAFNITTSNDRLGWRNAFVENVVKSFRAQQPHPVPLSTVFFGGGTPSLATREELSSILRSLPLAEGGLS
jgi:coproporphyrinogen III oxidase-like Fe-S oxidoreductase